MRKRTTYTIGLIAVALVAVGIFAASERPAATPGPTVDLDGAGGGTVSPSDGSTLTAEIVDKVVDKPRPPADLADKVLKSGQGSLTTKEQTAWNAYLAETKKIVLDNQTTLRSTLIAAITAITAGDTTKLGTFFAPDEYVDTAFAVKMAQAYPTILNSAIQSSVGVFTVADCTIYYGYSVVRWEDAGIVSEQTIALPLRFIGGQWYLTSIGSGTQGLKSVQSIRM
jgi:hypothetical protein